MATAAQAQEQEVDPSHAFIELNAGGGVQLGETDYLPSGAVDIYQYPLVYSFGIGGTAGVMIAENVALVGNYHYSRGQTRDGSIAGVIENVEGRVDYHTAVAGLRLWVPVGFGSLRGEVAVGVMFPHSTVLQFDYGPGLSQLPTPITGTGTRTANYSVGFGGQGRLGYEFPIAGPFYGAADFVLEVFQSENAGETTELENFVTDFEATPPVAVNATVFHADGAERPHTESVQSARVQLSFGAMF